MESKLRTILGCQQIPTQRQIDLLYTITQSNKELIMIAVNCFSYGVITEKQRARAAKKRKAVNP